MQNVETANVPYPRSEKNAGFTLIEMLITAALIGIVVVGVVSTFTTAFIADRNSQEVITGRNLAQEVMETMAAVDYGNLLAMHGNAITRDDFTATISVDQIAAGLLRVEVAVTHANVADVNVRMVTVVADRG